MSRLTIIEYFPFMRVKITEQSVHGPEGDSMMIKMAPDLRYRPVCHQCQSPAMTVHSQGHHRILRDLNLAQSRSGSMSPTERSGVRTVTGFVSSNSVSPMPPSG